MGVDQKAIANPSWQNVSPVIVSQAKPISDELLKLGITREELENLLVESNREVKLNPNNADAYLGRAMVRHALKDYTGAIADYNQVTKLRPKDVSAYSNRANARAESGDHKGAIAERTAALKMDPNGVLSLFIYNDRGLSYLALGNPKSAIAKRWLVSSQILIKQLNSILSRQNPTIIEVLLNVV